MSNPQTFKLKCMPLLSRASENVQEQAFAPAVMPTYGLCYKEQRLLQEQTNDQALIIRIVG